ncbi:MAG TPA: hypothetical protein VIV09_16510 [Pseudolabrys sp.]|jgi:hypothetical protein
MRGITLLVSGLGVGLIVGLAASDLNLGFSVGARPLVPTGSVVQSVDRTHKGDRAGLPMTRVGKQPLPSPAEKIMDGCEPAASALSASAQIAGRCAA